MNIMRKLSVLVCAGLISLSCSAQWGKTIKGNGNNVTIERNTGDYDGVAVSGWFDVDLVSGNEGEITLTGEENLLELFDNDNIYYFDDDYYTDEMSESDHSEDEYNEFENY